MAKEQAFLANGQAAKGIAFNRDEFASHSEYYMGTVHVWIWKREGNNIEVMLQKRAMSKKVNPGLYSISAAGHRDAGEDGLTTAIRESKEEIDLDIDSSRLSFCFSARREDPKRIFSVYTYEVQDDFTPTFNDGEVETCEWMSLSDFFKRAADPGGNNLADHGKEYFSLLGGYLQDV